MFEVFQFIAYLGLRSDPGVHLVPLSCKPHIHTCPHHQSLGQEWSGWSFLHSRQPWRVKLHPLSSNAT